MTIIPAIDIIDGNCVRLYKGDFRKQQNYFLDPLVQAEFFVQAGAKRIHVVDLDATRGDTRNRSLVATLCRNFPIELGGGIRSAEDVAYFADSGVHALVFGTLLAEEESQLRSLVKSYDVECWAGIDVAHGRPRIRGWQKDSGPSLQVLVERAQKSGMGGVIYTNIEKDGTMEGPDIKGTEMVGSLTSLPLILSGGISSYDDLQAVSQVPSIKGVILGKALYEKSIDLEKAFTLFGKNENE